MVPELDLSLIISMPFTYSKSLTLSVMTAAFAFRALVDVRASLILIPDSCAIFIAFITFSSEKSSQWACEFLLRLPSPSCSCSHNAPSKPPSF